MNLSPKAMRFMVEALEYRISAYEQQLENSSLDDDAASEITNDLMFLESLLQEFKKTLATPVAPVY
ncbi:MAG: hypothetical protein HC860_01515 [Alkalinema sp. RU_4_3]|nr:hypothetical protein [Alkalinema sp. RU_4_3]